MTDLSDRLMKLKEDMTKGPWSWFIEDYSLAFLHGPDEMADHVVSVSPCKSCKDSADPKEWMWGRCTTPHLADATVIALGDLFIPLAMALGRAKQRIAFLIEELGAVRGQGDWEPTTQDEAFDDANVAAMDEIEVLLAQIAERLET